MDGVVVIDKPAGPTSHDVVAVVRRVSGIDRVGHTGTLDPLATGVLPLVVGRATRLASLLSAGEKEYRATVCFGASTATYDAEATSPQTGNVADLDEDAVRKALTGFLGTSLQTPPPFSAKKVGGTPAYKLARKQKPVELKPVEVTVREIELCRLNGARAEVRVVCSTGFYVRSMAHDLGTRLGCGAYLEALRRTRAGDFTLADAVTLDALHAEGARVHDWLIPMGRLASGIPAVVLTPSGARRASHGNTLSLTDFQEPDAVAQSLTETSDEHARFRLFDEAGALVGIAQPAGLGLLHPAVVLV